MPSSSPWAGWTWVGTPKANLEPHKTLAKFNQRMPKTAYDGRYVVTRVMAKFANHKQPLVLIGGGGGNRTLLSAIREPYADTRFSRVSLSKARNPISYSRTLQYPRMLQRALRSGHYLVTDNPGWPARDTLRRCPVVRSLRSFEPSMMRMLATWWSAASRWSFTVIRGSRQTSTSCWI